MGDQNEKGSCRRLLVNCFVLMAILAFFAWLALPASGEGGVKSHWIQGWSNAKQIYTCVQGAALDSATTGTGIGWPADSGVKSGHEYVQRLVKENVLKVGDLTIFTTHGQKAAYSLDSISPEYIGFRIANVAESDPPETIFLVTPNFVDNTPHPFIDSRTWWGRIFPRPVGFIVVRKNGDGAFYTKPPGEIPPASVGILPPREPKFLDP